MNKAKLIGALVILLLFGGLVYYFFGNYSDGFRAGTVIKLSRKGNIFKTHEGQLNLGMVLTENSPSPTSVSNIWEFSVSGNEGDVISSLEKAMTTGQRVRLHYKEKYKTLPWRGDTRYFVYRVEMGPAAQSAPPAAPPPAQANPPPAPPSQP